VAAVVPCHLEPPGAALVVALRRLVGEVLVVDDGMPAEPAERLDAMACGCGARVLRLPVNAGKGHAIAAAIADLSRRARPPAGILVVDGDGQHPADRVPDFLDAAERAELVVGDRFGDLARMPLERRAANIGASLLISATTRRRVRDSQCGMRLLHGRALSDVPFPVGGYEAETRHLVGCLRSGIPVAWVPVPACYGREVSSFRRLRDSARIIAASVS